MQVTSTVLPEVLVIEPTVHGDHRGFFYEAWNRAEFDEVVGGPIEFVQDNYSRSVAGVVRGIHYQLPSPQGKLVRCTRGVVQDVAVDLRRSSERFLRWTDVELSEDNFRQLWIPPGFGHGFSVLSDVAELAYKATGFYAPEHDRVVAWNDPAIGVEWRYAGEPILSEKDRTAPGVDEARFFD